jgi:hypothetical protein
MPDFGGNFVFQAARGDKPFVFNSQILATSTKGY